MFLYFQANNSHISEGNEISAAVQSLLHGSVLPVTEYLGEFFCRKLFGDRECQS